MYPDHIRREALDLLSAGLSLNEVSKRMKVSRAALRAWPESGPRVAHHQARCPVCDGQSLDARGYSLLFGYCLGRASLSPTASGSFSLRIGGGARTPATFRAVVDAASAIHPPGASGHRCSSDRPMVRRIWGHWPCVLPQLAPGVGEATELEGWQHDLIEQETVAFLRGLFHASGCRTVNWTTRTVAGVQKRYEYPRWELVGRSQPARTWCCSALDRIGVAWRRPRHNCVAVSTRAGVARLDDLIGPR